MNQSCLDGKYPLKDRAGNPVAPEHFLGLFEPLPFYQDVRKFVRRVDNDIGIPFLTREEYEVAKKVLPEGSLDYYEKNIISSGDNKIFLRGKDYYLNLQNKSKEDKKTPAEFRFELLYDAILFDLNLFSFVTDSAYSSKSLEERMIVGSFLELYKTHLITLFTGLYESMKLEETIDVSLYNLLRQSVERVIEDYYKFTLEGRIPSPFLSKEQLIPVLDVIKSVVGKTHKVYDGKRYLTREFDHPGRMVLYAGHLLSQIKEKGRKYDLLVNILNGSVEIGLAVQTIDAMLGVDAVRSTTIFEVDFARYSRKDRSHGDVSTYSEFERIAIPSQLRQAFRQKVENKDTLIVDDNLNTGQSLHNVRKALSIAKSVDISVVEVTPPKRVIELLKRKDSNADISSEIILSESDLTYSPIGWWRDQAEMVKEKRFEKIIHI